MLILSRRQGERIVVPEYQLTVTVLDISRGRVRVGISAPSNVIVHRAEIIERDRSDHRPDDRLPLGRTEIGKGHDSYRGTSNLE